MYLVKMGAIREAVQARDLPDTHALLLLANTQANQYFSSLLPSALNKLVGVTNYFYIDSNRLGVVSPLYSLALSNGFLDSAVPIVICVADDVASLQLAAPLPDTTYKVDYEKGIVTLFTSAANPLPLGKFMSVTYTSGFDVEDEEGYIPTTPVFTGVPEWLYGAALLYASESYKLFKEWDKVPDKNGKSKAPTSREALKSHVEVLMVNHLRFFPHAYQPLDF